LENKSRSAFLFALNCPRDRRSAEPPSKPGPLLIVRHDESIPCGFVCLLLWTNPWRTEGDSNPRYAMNVYTLSRRAPSTTRPPVLFEPANRNACKAKSAILAEVV